MKDSESKMDILDLVLDYDITGYFKECMIRTFSNEDDKISRDIVIRVLERVDKEDIGRVAGLGLSVPALNGYLEMVGY